MAWKFRNIPIIDGEVIHPDQWVLNHAAYASEWNGMLDRDNLPSNQNRISTSEYAEPFTTANIEQSAFHRIFTSNSTYGFYFRNGFSGWASKQSDLDATVETLSTERYLGRELFTAESEGLVIAHWSGWLQSWPGQGPNDAEITHDLRWSNNNKVGANFSKTKHICANFRILVNGTEVANSGKLSAQWHNQCVAITGALPVEAGQVLVEVHGRAGIFKDLEYEMRSYSSNTSIFKVDNRELVTIFKQR